MSANTLGAQLLAKMFLAGAMNLEAKKEWINELNVFTVPDGDTGTNMTMTILSAVKEVHSLDKITMGDLAKAISSGSLRGARGNSGVITSLLFRGFSKGITGEEVTPESLKNAFTSGVEAAYKAVMKPTEGTILTVARVAGEKAAEEFENGSDVVTMFKNSFEAAKVALANTPEQLPALKKAGVVDAGGQGYVYILEGMLSVIENGIIIAADDGEETVAEATETNGALSAAGEYEAEITFTYCTEFIVNRDKECTKAPGELRGFLESIGDCVVVVDDDDIIKVHVHTDHPGKAIEEGITFGQLVHLKIENMRDQHERAKHDAEIAKKKQEMPKAPVKVESVEITKPYGFVSVCAGDGIKDLFGELGVDTVVSGGQTMNPSTDDILNAIEQTPAETVYVLPNNKNIIMAAEQTVELSSRKVIVLHTRTIPQGVAAMLAFTESEDSESEAIEMQKAAEKITSGQVTFAARDSDYDGHKIKKGEIMAMNEGKISFVDTDLCRATVKLCKQMVNKDSQFVTVLYGDTVNEELAASVEEELRKKLGDKVEITFINGGQPVYYFIISVE